MSKRAIQPTVIAENHPTSPHGVIPGGLGGPLPIINPFTVAVDTREQLAYSFTTLRANASHQSALIIVPTRRVTLSTGQGDYSIVGLPDIGIERKSKADLYSSIGQARDNFEQRLILMSDALGLGGSHVVVEATSYEILTDPPHHSKMNPRALWRTINSWVIRYPHVHWHFMWDRAAGEGQTFRLLEKYWNLNRKDEAAT